jgi:uncharacterized protein (TIRG00374 family)
MSDRAAESRARAVPWGRITLRLVLLALLLVSLYYFLPQLLDMFERTPELGEVRWRWFILMAVLMTGAFLAFWELTRVAVPEVSWFVAATSQLTSNAAAKVIPGGAMVGGAMYYQMLSVSGVDPGRAAAALAATSFLSTLVLLSLPVVAVVIAALSAPIPDGLLPVAIAGSALFAVMFVVAVVLVRFDKPLRAIGWVFQHTFAWLARKFGRDWDVRAENFIERRNEVVGALGQRWRKALGVAVTNWMLDYLTLVIALLAVGASPRPSLVLLAFAGAAVLAMIPLTPGGLGFVEVGLTGLLTLSGIPGSDALLATLAYRMFQFWLPIPAGAVAYVLFRRRYGKPSDL